MEKASGMHWTGGWQASTAGLDIPVVKLEIPVPVTDQMLTDQLVTGNFMD
jgi:hypothetical protein